MTQKSEAMSRMANDALSVLGTQIRVGRTRKGWTQAQLADRIGTQQKTISAIEAGRPTVAIGTVMDAAVMAGVRLFDVDDPDEMARMRRRGEEIIGLIPRRVRTHTLDVDDDF